MGLFDMFKKKETPVAVPQQEEPKRNVQGHKVVGHNYRQNEIKTLGILNPDYKLKKNELIKKGLVDVNVYEYNFPALKAELIQEPTNEYDPNAIKVVVDGVHVGYIKAGSCSRVKNLINNESIETVDAIIYGGNYKHLADCGEEIYEMDSSRGDVRVRIEIVTK